MSVNNSIRKLRSDIEKMKGQIKTNTESISAIQERNICNDLGAETFPGSGRWLFTYENIATRNGVSASTVSRIAEKYGMSRRNSYSS